MSRGRLRLLAVLALSTAAVVAAPAMAPAKATHPKRICTLTNSADGMGASTAVRIAVARALGITCERSAISTLRWTGADSQTQQLTDAGFKVVLNVRNQPAGVPAPPSVPPLTDSEFASFEKNVRQIVEAYHPALLTVENEEEAPNFFSGTMEQYVKELRAAIDVAHRHGAKVTNGGITGLPMALITWQRLRTHKSQAAADDFARRTFGQTDARPGWAGILDDLLAKPYTGLENTSAQEGWDRAKYLIKAYKKPEGKHATDKTPLDFVNFHWYFKDPKALRQAIHVLEHKTNRKVVTTEIGQYDRAPSTVTGILQTAVDAGLQWIVWYDGDGDPAQALHNGDCSLRANGQAFRLFVANHAPNQPAVPCTPGP